jgi:hypothetical protein
MTKLDEVAERDGWRCWLCDEPIDPGMSSNDSRGPSVDSMVSNAKAKSAKGKNDSVERLAHRGCNSNKGATKVAVPWPSRLFVSDPAPLIGVAERLGRKAGREVVARCTSRSDADETAAWLVDRFSRLAPDVPVTASIDTGGGQFLVALTSSRR